MLASAKVSIYCALLFKNSTTVHTTDSTVEAVLKVSVTNPDPPHLLVSEGRDKLAVLAAVFVFFAEQCHGWVAPLMGPQALHGHEDSIALGARVTPCCQPLLQLALWHYGPGCGHQGRCPSFTSVCLRIQVLHGNSGIIRIFGRGSGSLQAVDFGSFIPLHVAIS